MSPDTELSSNKDFAYTNKNPVTLNDLDSRIIVLATVSVFINVYLCGAVALLSVAYALANREKRLMITGIAHVRWLALFSLLALIVPMIYGNWLGLAVSAAIITIFIFYLYLCTVMTEGLFKAVVDISCMISLIYVIIALFQRMLGLTARSPSTFQNANYYSYALELVMMLSFYRLSTVKKRGHKAFLIIVILANISALCMADSRSAWPAIFGGLLVLFILNKKTISLLVLIGIYALGIKLALSFPAIFPRLDNIDIASFVRTNIWMEAINGIKQYPVFGVGGMGYYYLSSTKEFFHSHNILLESLISYGITGTFFLAAYFILTFRTVFRRYRENRQNAIYPLVFAVVAVTAIHGLTDVTVLWPQTGMLLVMILAGGSFNSNNSVIEKTTDTQ